MTSIEWTDVTWNPVRGCSRVSEGCRNCYAEKVAARFSGPGMPYEGLVTIGEKGARWNGTTKFVAEHLGDPLRWKRPRRVFVNSMSDLFHESLANEQIAAVFGVMAACPQHVFQILTKRPKRAREFFDGVFGLESCEETVAREASVVANIVWDSRATPGSFWGTQMKGASNRRPWPGWPLPNVWLGVSVEDQQTADERIPVLLATPAAVRFVSYEPALAPVDFDQPRCDIHGRDEVASGPEGEFCNECAANGYADELSFGHWLDPLNGGLQWIIVGGESGRGARPFDLAWARSTVEQCREAGVPAFVKQLGARPCSATLEDVPIPRVATSEWADVPGIGERWTFRFAHGKGGDVEEWPEDLRVREWPEVTRG